MKGIDGFSALISEKDYEMKKIYEHIERYIGSPAYVNIDTMTENVNISLYTCLADNKSRYHTIITVGMSALSAKCRRSSRYGNIRSLWSICRNPGLFPRRQ